MELIFDEEAKEDKKIIEKKKVVYRDLTQAMPHIEMNKVKHNKIETTEAPREEHEL